jgi:PAS domain-containing protein
MWRSFCAHALRATQSGKPLLIADLRTQPWYREQTTDAVRLPAGSVRSPELAACAAAPLAGANGRVLGAFCVGDLRRRRWEREREDVETLRDLAATAAQHLRPRAGMLERDQQAQAVAASALDTIIEAIPDGVYICDASGNRTRVNAHGAALLGLSPGQALAPIAAFKATNKPRYPDGMPMPIEELPLARAVRGETRTDIRFAVTQYGTSREVQLLACCAPIRNAAGEITGGVTVCTDVTELTRLERQKDDFLSIASDEMRTPLAEDSPPQAAGRGLPQFGGLQPGFRFQLLHEEHRRGQV